MFRRGEPGQVGEGRVDVDEFYHGLRLRPVLGDSGRETESVDAPSNPDPGGLDGGGGVDVALDLVDIHVTLVLEVSLESVVVQDDGLKDILEVLVGVGVSGVNAAVLIVEINGTGDGLNNS